MGLSIEEINRKLDEIKFENVESIIGELAAENGRAGLVHRELRDFNFFIAWFIWGKKGDDYEDLYDWDFKEDYDEFYAYLGDYLDDADALYRWACLYYIHETQYCEWDDAE